MKYQQYKPREPYAAGTFYERDKDALIKQIEASFLNKEYGPGELPSNDRKSERKIVGLISPHAGYIYSGPIAANGYYLLSLEKKPEVVVVVGPNHQGIGRDIAAYPDGYWKTPLGNVQVDTAILKEVDSKIKFDPVSHFQEHSIEVQLPFLQYIYGNDFSFVPICLNDQSPEIAEHIGNTLSMIMSKHDAVVIASTDFTHYEPNEEAHRRDKLAIDAILSKDLDVFYNTIFDNDITMCGYGAVGSFIHLSNLINGNIELVKYGTSGDITGDKSFVVGYASMKLSKP